VDGVTRRGITEHADYRWKNKYSKMEDDQTKRLKALEKENAQTGAHSGRTDTYSLTG
jgi:hypothetical protein